MDGKYAFKPKYNLKDKKALLRLLDKHDQRGLGGILLEDIEEGLPNAQKAIKVSSSCLRLREPLPLSFSKGSERPRANLLMSCFCSQELVQEMKLSPCFLLSVQMWPDVSAQLPKLFLTKDSSSPPFHLQTFSSPAFIP